MKKIAAGLLALLAFALNVPEVRAQHNERDFSTTAAPTIAAPRFSNIFLSGAVSTITLKSKAANSYQVRGLGTYAGTVTTSGSVAIKVDSTTIATATLTGLAGTASYLAISPPVEVPAGATVSFVITSSGVSNLLIQLDTIP